MTRQRRPYVDDYPQLAKRRKLLPAKGVICLLTGLLLAGYFMLGQAEAAVLVGLPTWCSDTKSSRHFTVRGEMAVTGSREVVHNETGPMGVSRIVQITYANYNPSGHVPSIGIEPKVVPLHYGCEFGRLKGIGISGENYVSSGGSVFEHEGRITFHGYGRAICFLHLTKSIRHFDLNCLLRHENRERPDFKISLDILLQSDSASPVFNRSYKFNFSRIGIESQEFANFKILHGESYPRSSTGFHFSQLPFYEIVANSTSDDEESSYKNQKSGKYSNSARSTGYQFFVYSVPIWCAGWLAACGGICLILWGFLGHHRIIAGVVGLMMITLGGLLGWVGAASLWPKSAFALPAHLASVYSRSEAISLLSIVIPELRFHDVQRNV